MIILDVGKSMNEGRVGDTSKLEAAVKAVNLLVQQKVSFRIIVHF